MKLKAIMPAPPEMIRPRVNRDGTFDLKIDYRYEEGESFVILFSPRGQWSTISDHYGPDGEKLVGSLVETSGNIQKVKLEIDYKHD